MQFVKTWKDIECNLERLEEYRTSSDRRYIEFYNHLILYGICFVMHDTGNRILLGPSRFVGYINNDMDAHQANGTKDGRETNPIICEILGEEPVGDRDAEKDYQKFCEQIGLKPRPTGSFGIRRKFWRVKH